MRAKFATLLCGTLALAIPMTSRAGVIAAYNFGPNGTSFTAAATTKDPNVGASGIETASDFGTNTVFSPVAGDDGVGGTSAWYTDNPGGNYLSVQSNGSTTDNGFWVETIVTAAPGFVINPTSFVLVGGAGGASNVRSAYIFDNVDGFPTNIATNATGAPTITGGDLLASGNFTSVRGASGPPSMNQIQAASFPSGDANLSSFTVRAYFDTQGQVSKNIDLGTLELDGSVAAVPEPMSFALAAFGAAGVLLTGRRRGIAVVA